MSELASLRGRPWLDAFAWFQPSGWQEARGSPGDWARVFVSPKGDFVARVTPFDPAHRLFVDRVRATGKGNRHFPDFHEPIPLEAEGYIVEMEHCAPAGDQAAELVEYLHGRGPAPTEMSEAELSQARELVASLEGLRLRDQFEVRVEYKSADLRRGPDGHVKILDPLHLKGGDLLEMMKKDLNRGLEAAFTYHEVMGFLTIPYFEKALTPTDVRARAAKLRECLSDTRREWPSRTRNVHDSAGY